NFDSILIYPSTYVANQGSFDGFVESVEKRARLGESWRRGPIVLSWDAVLHGASDIRDGQNVVLHEFAHKLDEEDGALDGAPKLTHRAHYITWARVMQAEFDTHQQKAQRGQDTVLDHYGAGEPAEFFAVLTETFFEKPKQLKSKHPELYEEAKRFFNLDPVSWHDSKG
ncbi:zinc-dependent peptidase, partial [Oligoflexia bacterium]|nr:zinc-dependent peptidase [Oligoflexia bacterium]